MATRGKGPRSQFLRALEPWRTDHIANHNYSVWFSEDRRRFHRLQWGGCTVVRTHDPVRFGRALALHIGGHGAPSSGLLRTDGVVAVHDGQATVLPAVLRQRIDKFERPLREEGVILHDAPWVDIDLSTGEVVIEPPRLPPARFDDIVSSLPQTRRPDPAVFPGSYALAAWYFPWTKRAQQPIPSKADAVALVLGALRWPLSDDDQLPALQAMLQRVPFGRLPLRTPSELLDQIRT